MNQVCQPFRPRVNVVLHTPPSCLLRLTMQKERENDIERETERKTNAQRKRKRTRPTHRKRKREITEKKEREQRERKRERDGQIGKGITIHVGTVTQKSYTPKNPKLYLQRRVMETHLQPPRNGPRNTKRG